MKEKIKTSIVTFKDLVFISHSIHASNSPCDPLPSLSTLLPPSRCLSHSFSVCYFPCSVSPRRNATAEGRKRRKRGTRDARMRRAHTYTHTHEERERESVTDHEENTTSTTTGTARRRRQQRRLGRGRRANGGGVF